MTQEGSPPSTVELRAWLRLCHTEGIGPARGRALLEHLGPPEAILQAGEADLVALGRELLVNPNWPMDAALKLGAAKPYEHLPPVYAYYLERRKRSFQDLSHSTARVAMRAPSNAQ